MKNLPQSTEPKKPAIEGEIVTVLPPNLRNVTDTDPKNEPKKKPGEGCYTPSTSVCLHTHKMFIITAENQFRWSCQNCGAILK